jgi:hypothetical protein
MSQLGGVGDQAGLGGWEFWKCGSEFFKLFCIIVIGLWVIGGLRFGLSMFEFSMLSLGGGIFCFWILYFAVDLL